ncbi:MAG TPA: ferric iron uptake transcriptional regulator [Gammaproteobacteria bacterium]|nr:ferric iron uptake transcriptional regulator [Gammaproteobacteria bacterium]
MPHSSSSQNNLKNAGLKVTLPRTKILHILETDPAAHLSAEDIYKKLLEHGDDVGLATVYRVLTQFESAGLVIRHNFGDGRSVFELDQGEHHDHLVCVKCGQVEEFVDNVIEQRQAEIARNKNFQMTDHSLYIFGICAACSA